MALKHLVACLLLTAFGACGGPAADPDPVVVPALRVAYNVYTNTPEDNYEIFVRDLDGKNAKNITNTPGVDWVYSAHEDELYFLSDRDTCHRCYFLYAMDANGNNVRRISDHQMQDSWMSARMDGGALIVDPKGIATRLSSASIAMAGTWTRSTTGSPMPTIRASPRTGSASCSAGRTRSSSRTPATTMNCT
ncbi:MAG: hypothetical protein IPG69_10930 [Flavobacteriales bacterium]|nr:hypothetical protein [Flavobacteriales bacterium]